MSDSNLTAREIEVAQELGRTIAQCPLEYLPLARQRAESYAIMFGKRRPHGAVRTQVIDDILWWISRSEVDHRNAMTGTAATVRRAIKPLIDSRRPSAEIFAKAVDAASEGHYVGVHVLAMPFALTDQQAIELAKDDMLAAISKKQRRR